MYTVERMGDWSYLTPGQLWHDIFNVVIYPKINILRVTLPCCICYGWRLNAYSITTDKSSMTQIFTLKSLGFGGGSVDAVKHRVINWGLFFSETVTVYDLNNGLVTTNTFKPNLCDFTANCFVSPCSVSKCPLNPGAVCMDDYCGCNARWFCGTSDVTNYCDTGPQICPTQITKPEIEPIVTPKITVLRV